MTKCSGHRIDVWLLTLWQQSEVQGINQEQSVVWQMQAVYEKWGDCVEMDTSENGTNLFLISHLIINLSWFLGVTWGSWDTFTYFRPMCWRSSWPSGAQAKVVWFSKGLHGNSSIWKSLALFDSLRWQEKYPAQMFYFMDVLHFWTLQFNIFLNKIVSEGGRGEHCAKLIFQAFPSADLRYNSEVNNKCITSVQKKM